MYYFYSIRHRTTNIIRLGVTSFNPLSDKRFRDRNIHWRNHLLINGSTPDLLDIKIMHASNDLNVIIQWRKHYYKQWNVINNPKYINSRSLKKFAKKRKYGHPNSATIIRNYRWYNNGININIRVKKGTQPPGYKPGRIILHKITQSNESKALISKAQSRPVVSPRGRTFKSIREAAIAEGVSASAISQRIKNKVSGWKYA